MNTSLEETLALYDYQIAQDRIATVPATPRDSAKLLIYDRKTGATSFSTFADICEYLPKNAVLVFNKTKVFPARMRLKKSTGGMISALYIAVETTRWGVSVIRTLAEGKIKTSDKLDWENGHFFTVTERDGKYAMLQPSFPVEELPMLLEKFGETPLPPYIKNSALNETERRSEYQTVFAKDNGSVAAPTAGLHFTENLITKIEQSGRSIRYVTLHVGLGTFAPVTDEHWEKKQLHEEWYEIDSETADFLQKAKAEGRPIIAVGTTVTRALESAFSVETTRWDVSGSTISNPASSKTCAPHVSTRLNGTTNIFLTPDNPPHFIDGLITNFHVPKSSLLMLVSALTGREKLLDLYNQAIEKDFRFFSFGDGMMIV